MVEARETLELVKLIGQGVAELYNITGLVQNVGTWEYGNAGRTNVLTY